MVSLFDFLNRHQIYLEGVKNWYQDDFRRYLRLFQAELRKLFGKLDVGTLGELTAAKYRSFLKQVDGVAVKVFGQYGTEFLSEMRRFLGVDAIVQRAGFAAITLKDVSAPTIPQIWKQARESIVPALGKTPLEATSELVAMMRERIRTTFNTGFADNKKLDEIELDLKGEGPDYKGGTLGRIWASVRAHIATLLQHAKSQTSDVIGAVVFNCYQWVSVIDSATSSICRERNGTVYRRGDGPIPPAHPNCRSMTVPCDCDTASGEKVPTYFAWLKSQSRDFLNDVFGDGPAGDLVSGRASAEDYSRFDSVARLTVDDFALKVKRLLS